MNKDKLYTVYHNNPECPEKIFETFEREKAVQFCEEYNRTNNPENENTWTTDRMDYCETDLSDIENKASEIIDTYVKKKKVYFICDFEKNEFKVDSIIEKIYKKDSIRVDEDIFGYDRDNTRYLITLVFDLNYPINFDDKTIKRRLKKKYNWLKRVQIIYS